MMSIRQMLIDRPVFFRIVFGISFLTSLGLFIGGFFMPPMGEIDGSVLTAAGILLAFSSVSMIPDIITSGRTATFRHGDTQVTIGSKTIEEDETDA